MSDGDDPDLCGYPTTNGEEPCQNPATEDDGSCWLKTHGEDPADFEDDGRGGAPEGNDNAVGNPGNPDASPPDGNWNAMEHRLHMALERRFESFTDEQIRLFRDYYLEYSERATIDSQAARLASLAVIADDLEDQLLNEGIFYKKQIADPDELLAAGRDPDEAFAEVPKKGTVEAYTDALREVRLGLKHEGISGPGSGGPGGTINISSLWEDVEE